MGLGRQAERQNAIMWISLSATAPMDPLGAQLMEPRRAPIMEPFGDQAMEPFRDHLMEPGQP